MAQLNKGINVNLEIMYAILKQVFDKLHRSPFWEITPDFILTLGEAYLSLLANETMKQVLLSEQ